VKKTRAWPDVGIEPIRCIYVSNTAMYKHQWVAVRAIAALRKRGHNITLTLVGGGIGKPQRLLEKQLAISDHEGAFVQQLDFLPQKDLPAHLSNSDLFVFASSCETFGITLLEAMSVGLPIASSNRSSLPETLQDGGVYFDPEDDESIANAVEQLIKDPVLRDTIAWRAKEIAGQYSWKRCSDETFAFLVETINHIKENEQR
jgi:glycosyltransferase involved in cell wall biosynthesis